MSLRNKSHAARRVAYMLSFGDIPRGQCVLHRCDNPACINPVHLFLGTLADNNADRKRKGRNSCRVGEKNTCVKLSPEAIQVIREAYRTGRSQRSIGEDFGICQQQVSAIVNRKQWSHVA